MNRIIFVFLIVVLGFLSVASIWDNDIWSHLKTGEWIMAHHMVASRDIFSYTAAGQPWIATSWLSQIVFYTVYHWVGIPGLIIFKSMVIIAAFMLLYALCVRQGTDTLLAAVVVFLVAVLSRERFVERPHIFSFLFLAAFLYLLKAPDRRWRWLIVPLELLWANMHAENILGIMLCVVYIGHEMWESRRYFLPSVFLFSVFAVSFLNPISWQAPFFGLISMGNSHEAYLKYVIELRSPTFETVFRPFWCYAAAAVLSIAFDRRRKIPEMLTSAVFLLLAIKVRRFIPEFLIISVPGVVSGLTSLFETMLYAENGPGHSKKQSDQVRWVTIMAIFIMMAFAAVYVVDHQEPRMRPGLGINQDALPVRAAEFIAHNRLQGRMFNVMSQGGYLLWRLYPQEKVFIDGRIDVFGPLLLEREVTFSQPQVWKALMDQYHFDFAILDNMDVFGQYPARVLDEDNNWALIYFDDVNLIYVRKDGADAGFAQARAYHFLKPNSPDSSYINDVKDKKALKNELLRAYQESPSITAAVLLAGLDQGQGDFDEAIKVLAAAVKGHPRVAGLRVLLARAQKLQEAMQKF